jgi:hypothetical protein
MLSLLLKARERRQTIMWRKKKFIIIALVTVLVVGGILGGVAIAQADDDDSSQPQARGTALLEKVAEIYEKNTGVAIDSEELQKALTEAGQELRDEAKDAFLQKLVDEGKITQEQADQFKAWLEDMPAFPTDEFKAWMDERPAFPTDEFKAWGDARPDMPDLFGEKDRLRIGPFGGMNRGFDKFGGGFWGRFGGRCTPENEVE